MSGQRRYLVTYDVTDAKRLRRIHKRLLGFGDPLQYSVFQCDLTDIDRIRLGEALARVIHHGEDRVLIVDLGAASGRGKLSVEYLGLPPRAEPPAGPVIV